MGLGSRDGTARRELWTPETAVLFCPKCHSLQASWGGAESRVRRVTSQTTEQGCRIYMGLGPLKALGA